MKYARFENCLRQVENIFRYSFSHEEVADFVREVVAIMFEQIVSAWSEGKKSQFVSKEPKNPNKLSSAKENYLNQLEKRKTRKHLRKFRRAKPVYILQKYRIGQKSLAELFDSQRFAEYSTTLK